MVGERNRPDEIRDRISQLIRYEQQSLPTASLARIKELDENSRRATVETVPDGGTETNVPVASPFATDGEGDLTPLNPEIHDTQVRGIVIYLHHPLDRHLTTDGFKFDGEREHDETHAIFLPAQIWFDGDSVPYHDKDERSVSHPDGNKVSITEEEARLEHHLGAALEILGSPEPELEGEDIITEDRDYEEEWGEEYVETPDNTSWPIADEQDETAARMAHHNGPAVTATERGVSVETPRDSHRLEAGRFTDGERVPLAGPHQHFHIQEHADGSKSLVGPQLSFREFVAWMTDPDRQEQLDNADAYNEARTYAENYLDWLEGEIGREIDPTDSESWPETEPMPLPDEIDSFMPESYHAAPDPPEVMTTAHTPTVTTE